MRSVCRCSLTPSPRAPREIEPDLVTPNEISTVLADKVHGSSDLASGRAWLEDHVDRMHVLVRDTRATRYADTDERDTKIKFTARASAGEGIKSQLDRFDSQIILTNGTRHPGPSDRCLDRGHEAVNWHALIVTCHVTLALGWSKN